MAVMIGENVLSDLFKTTESTAAADQIDPSSTILTMLGPEDPASPPTDPHSDHGNMLGFCEENDRNVIASPQAEYRYLVWDGTRYRNDATREAERRMQDYLARRGAVFRCSPDKSLQKFGAQCHSTKMVKQLSEAFSMATSLNYAEFDAGDWDLVTPGLRIDLKEMSSRAPSKDDMGTKVAGVFYDSAAECPVWEKFLSTSFRTHSEVIPYLQRAIGYTLTGATHEHVLFICYGTGANGKSTLLETVRAMMGDYAAVCDRRLIMRTRLEGGASPELARLQGVRFASLPEAPEDGELDEESIKKITGGDTISARFLHRNPIEFKPKAKFWVATNTRPKVRGSDIGIWRRLQMIPFLDTIPEELRDKELQAKLLRELPGIFNWALHGLAAWHAHGLAPPEICQAQISEMKDENDAVSRFIAERCETGKTLQIKKGALFDAFRTWAKEAGEDEITQRQLSRRLQQLGYTEVRDRCSRYWAGIRMVGIL